MLLQLVWLQNMDSVEKLTTCLLFLAVVLAVGMAAMNIVHGLRRDLIYVPCRVQACGAALVDELLWTIVVPQTLATVRTLLRAVTWKEQLVTCLVHLVVNDNRGWPSRKELVFVHPTKGTG